MSKPSILKSGPATKKNVLSVVFFSGSYDKTVTFCFCHARPKRDVGYVEEVNRKQSRGQNRPKKQKKNEEPEEFIQRRFLRDLE